MDIISWDDKAQKKVIVHNPLVNLSDSHVEPVINKNTRKMEDEVGGSVKSSDNSERKGFFRSLIGKIMPTGNEVAKNEDVKMVDPAEINRLNLVKSRTKSSTKIRTLLSLKKNLMHDKIDEIFSTIVELHGNFSEDDDSDYMKLDQFHYYYTDNIINLLHKLKLDKDGYLEKFHKDSELINDNIENYESKLKGLDNNRSTWADELVFLCQSILAKRNKLRIEHRRESIDSLESYPLSKELFSQLIDKPDDVEFEIYSEFTVESELFKISKKNSHFIEYLNSFTFKKSNLHIFYIKPAKTYFVYNMYTDTINEFDGKVYKDILNTIKEKKKSLKLILNKNKVALMKLDSENEYVFTEETEAVLSKFLEKIKSDDTKDSKFTDTSEDLKIELGIVNSIIDLEKLDV
jgi:hypothetical protein